MQNVFYQPPIDQVNKCIPPEQECVLFTESEFRDLVNAIKSLNLNSSIPIFCEIIYFANTGKELRTFGLSRSNIESICHQVTKLSKERENEKLQNN